MIDKKFVKKMKKKLEKDKKSLEKDLATFADKNIHNLEDYKARYPDFGTESDENAKEVSAFEDRLSVERTLEKELRDVNNALQRI